MVPTEPGAKIMPTWLDNIMSPLNAAGEGLQKLIETRDLVKFGDTFRKMHGEILAAMQGAIAAQTREATLLSRVSDLEKEVASFETWDAEKQRYELKQLIRGAPTFAYALKPDAQPPEIFHCICATCYQKRLKSILQFSRPVLPGSGERVLACPVCNTEVRVIGWPPTFA
jgi:hypothetical protein